MQEFIRVLVSDPGKRGSGKEPLNQANPGQPLKHSCILVDHSSSWKKKTKKKSLSARAWRWGCIRLSIKTLHLPLLRVYTSINRMHVNELGTTWRSANKTFVKFSWCIATRCRSTNATGMTQQWTFLRASQLRPVFSGVNVKESDWDTKLCMSLTLWQRHCGGFQESAG